MSFNSDRQFSYSHLLDAFSASHNERFHFKYTLLDRIHDIDTLVGSLKLMVD